MSERVKKFGEAVAKAIITRYRRRNDRLDSKGREYMDSTPMAPPVGYKREPTIAERIRDMVRGEHLRNAALAAGAETFEEADDFDIPDDDTYDPSTPYEEVFEPELAAAGPSVPAPAAGGEGGGGDPTAPPPAPDPSHNDVGGISKPAASPPQTGSPTPSRGPQAPPSK